MLQENHRRKRIALIKRTTQVIRTFLPPIVRSIDPNLKENISVSDSHHPFGTPTKHILATRNRETKTFPKSTYASGDAGIPGESQKEITPAGTKSEIS
jgi:hypothetical protein